MIDQIKLRRRLPQRARPEIRQRPYFQQYLINTGCLFFRNPPVPQISTFSSGQKGCAYYEKSAYYEWAQYLFVTNQEKGIYIEILFILKIAFALFKLEKFKKRLRLCL